MTSTNKGTQVGGYRNAVDQQKLGPALVITAGLILGIPLSLWVAFSASDSCLVATPVST